VSELDWIGCELYNLGSYWIFLLWIMDVDPFPRIHAPQMPPSRLFFNILTFLNLKFYKITPRDLYFQKLAILITPSNT
jgi:hypothetical protein